MIELTTFMIEDVREKSIESYWRKSEVVKNITEVDCVKVYSHSTKIV